MKAAGHYRYYIGCLVKLRQSLWNVTEERRSKKIERIYNIFQLKAWIFS